MKFLVYEKSLNVASNFIWPHLEPELFQWNKLDGLMLASGFSRPWPWTQKTRNKHGIEKYVWLERGIFYKDNEQLDLE